MRLLLFALAALALPAAAAAQAPAPGTYEVHAIDVGTGLAVFVQGADFTLLYDAGSKEDSAGGANNRVLAYLRKVRPGLTTLDHVILSHPHEDHVEMLDEVLTAYDVGHIWDSGSFNPTCGYRNFMMAVAAESGAVYHTSTARRARRETFSKCSGRRASVPASLAIALGTATRLGANAEMTVLHSEDTRRESDLNNASIVVRLDLGGRRVLLTGDAEAGERELPTHATAPRSAEAKLRARFARELPADILVVAHHGSKTSSRRVFLNAVGAKYFVISSGPFRYGRRRNVVLPDAEVLTELRRHSGAVLWRTDLNDSTCIGSPPKIGIDDDGPGGCDNIRIVIGPAGAITGGYHRITD